MRTTRIESIDKLRGLIMIVMALDHVRDFFHVAAQTADPLDLTTTSPALFFTRWITHFCAPVFLLLSGLSASLAGRNKSRGEAAAFLFKRGLWLVVVDLLLVSLALTFNPSYNFIMLTVLWAIGVSMMILGLLIRVAPKLILPVGLIIFFSHDLLTSISFNNNAPGAVMRILFQGLFIVPVSSTHTVAFLYAILPWTSVMLLGYSLGRIIYDRKKILVASGVLIALFLILRIINVYGDPAPWTTQQTSFRSVMSFINTSKYPPSLQFLCMTLGPALLLLLLFQKRKSASRSSNIFLVYGRTPFFYYLLHLFLAHMILVIAFFATGHTGSQVIDKESPFFFRPKMFGFELPAVYLYWFLVVALLYFPCRWYYRYKQQHHHWWLSYL